MKYVIIFFCSLFFAGTVLAAKTPMGTVPVVPPLQPAPVGVHPNYNKNIQYDGAADEGFASSSTEQGQKAGSISDTGNNLSPSKALAAAEHATAGKPLWLAWILLLVGAVILFIWYKQRKQV